jgi:hypothetical protein
MRATFGILLLALFLCGCSPRRVVYLDQTIKVVAGKDLAIGHYVLNVRKRDGNSVSGIRVVCKDSDGTETVIMADTGTLTPGPTQRSEAEVNKQRKLRVVVLRNSMKLTLFHATTQIRKRGGTTSAQGQVELFF